MALPRATQVVAMDHDAALTVAVAIKATQLVKVMAEKAKNLSASAAHLQQNQQAKSHFQPSLKAVKLKAASLLQIKARNPLHHV